jgi:hypothetical protein
VKDSHLAYLHGIQVGSPIESRIEELLEDLEWISPEAIDRIFGSDQIAADSEDRIYTSLWVFTEHFLLESKQFLSEIDMDITRFGLVTYLEIKAADFSLRQPGRPRKAARLFVKAQLGHGPRIGGTTAPDVPPPGLLNFPLFPQSSLSATGRNCSYLSSIVQEILLPRLRGSGGSAPS